jgi:hypothetical protein
LDGDALETYACKEVSTLSLSKICTSVCIGFYLGNSEAFEKFRAKLKAVAKIDHSIFSVYDSSPTFVDKKHKAGTAVTQTVLINEFDDDEEGFEML